MLRRKDQSLVDVMHQAEDLESLDNLHALSNLMQTIREHHTQNHSHLLILS